MSNNNMEKIKIKILKILEITAINKSFILQDLDKDLEKQQKILELEEDINKNFPVTVWSYIRGTKIDRPYINLIRTVFSSCKVKYIIKNTYMKVDNNKIQITIYMINV
jgi:hypothetical protein